MICNYEKYSGQLEGFRRDLKRGRFDDESQLISRQTLQHYVLPKEVKLLQCIIATNGESVPAEGGGLVEDINS